MLCKAFSTFGGSSYTSEAQNASCRANFGALFFWVWLRKGFSAKLMYRSDTESKAIVVAKCVVRAVAFAGKTLFCRVILQLFGSVLAKYPDFIVFTAPPTAASCRCWLL